MSTPWTGIIDPARATDWSGAGVTGGVPSDSWTQCGSTIAAYSGTTQTINAALQACGSNQYVLLGPGTFNLTSGGAISNGLLINKSNVELRGSGSNTTFLVLGSGAVDACSGGYHTGLCFNGAQGAYWVTDPAVPVTAGLSQGSTTLTITVQGAYSSGTTYTKGQVVSSGGHLFASMINGNVGNTPVNGGYTPWSDITANQTIVGLDQASLGNSGDPASSNPEVDNSGYFDCDVAYNAGTGHGCAVNGPDGGNQRLNRPQNELFQLSGINTSTGVLTLLGSVRAPNWNSAETPEIFIAANPVQNSGVRNLSLDVTATAQNGIVMYYVAQSWVKGVRIVEPSYAGIWNVVGCHNTFEMNYIYSTSHLGSGADIFGLNSAPSTDNLWQNNIVQGCQVAYGNEGPNTGDVIAYNFFVNDYNGNDGIYPAVFPHAGNRFQLFEGNILNSYFAENFHGPKIMNTLFRNFITGWESCANGNCGSSTSKASATTPIRMVAYSRYHNIIGNVLGTPGYHTSYSTTAAFSSLNIFEVGSGNGSIPTDSLVASSFSRWANYDVVSGATRFCGNSSDTGWSTTCGSTSEIPTGFSPYGQPLPTVGDVTAGQAALPASFYLSSKPSWFGLLPFPAAGPDISGGNVGQCTGTFGNGVANVSGQYGGVPALFNAQCTGTSLASAWAGHVNANPAMACALNTMNMAPDGTLTGPLPFDSNICYGSSSSSTPTISFGRFP